MMKKNGFTLAEVLITLAIIGVVATLTLPALMTNTAEQQAKTALKKGINILTEAAQMNAAISGFDYASISSTDTTNDTAQSLYGLLSNRASIDYQKTQSDTAARTAVGSSDNFVVFFRDGSALSYNATNSTAKATSGKVSNGEMQTDGLVYGIAAKFDMNGDKSPNILSNCKGDVSSATEDVTTIADCNDKTKRVIKDQFGVRLRSGYAVPNGAAARWAFEN